MCFIANFCGNKNSTSPSTIHLELNKSSYKTRERYEMIEVFKTDVNNEKEAVKLLQHLHQTFPHITFNFDLQDCDRILRAKGCGVDDSAIIREMQNKAYCCEVLPD